LTPSFVAKNRLNVLLLAWKLSKFFAFDKIAQKDRNPEDDEKLNDNSPHIIIKKKFSKNKPKGQMLLKSNFFLKKK